MQVASPPLCESEGRLVHFLCPVGSVVDSRLEEAKRGRQGSSRDSASVGGCLERAVRAEYGQPALGLAVYIANSKWKVNKRTRRSAAGFPVRAWLPMLLTVGRLYSPDQLLGET